MADLADGEAETTSKQSILCTDYEQFDSSDCVSESDSMSSIPGDNVVNIGTELRQRKHVSKDSIPDRITDVSQSKCQTEMSFKRDLLCDHDSNIAESIISPRKTLPLININSLISNKSVSVSEGTTDKETCITCETGQKQPTSLPQVPGKQHNHITPETVFSSSVKSDEDTPQTNEASSERKDADHIENTEELKRPGVWEYFCSELTRGYILEHDEAKFMQKRQRVYTVIRIPGEVEKFMLYGFFQCMDAFLFLITFLPLRVIMAVMKLFSHLVFCFSKGTGRILDPAQICDLIKVFILVFCSVAMNYVDTSMMYHIVRGQTVIKLYIFFNMLDVADKLFSSFGQDILDALFWTATEPRGKKREHLGLLPHLALAVLYVFLHAFLVLFQATTLNVAFNSHNKALLTIMMSNNFVELKGSVFKKFEKNNLFQMSCSDVRERFHLLMLMFFVCVRNLTEFSWNLDHLWLLVPDMVMVMLAELLVDWVKHAFITKFNEISSDVYRDYTVSLAYDMASSRQKNAFSDHSDLVSRRMGFIPLPLAVILVRVMHQSVHIRGWMAAMLIALSFLCLTTFKILNSVVLLGVACDLINNNKSHPSGTTSTSATFSVGSNMRSPSSKSEPSTPNPFVVRPVLKKSQSTSRLNVTFGEIGEEAAEPTMTREDSFSNKALLSNSTVNLSSVELNEEFVKDTGIVTKPPEKNGTDPKKGKPQKPLSEIDRYTMCSNRII